jgi:hypothetical protein
MNDTNLHQLKLVLIREIASPVRYRSGRGEKNRHRLEIILIPLICGKKIRQKILFVYICLTPLNTTF